LIGQPWRLAFALQADGWWLRSDIIWAKCLSGGTEIYAQTQKGIMPCILKDLVRLNPSTVKLWTGKKWAKVIAWVEGGSGELEIELRSGQRIGCSRNHKWMTIERGLIKTEDLIVGDSLAATVLPEPEAQDTKLDDKEIGWFVGMFIAEGSYGKDRQVLQIASHVKEKKRYERLKKIASDYDGTAQMHNTQGNAATVNIYGHILLGIIKTYVSGTTAKTKHLTTKAWQKNNVFLKSLLNGYLEGDGHYGNRRWSVGFTLNDAWANNLRTICSRLDLRIRLKRTVHNIGDKKYPGWRMHIIEKSLSRTRDTEIIAIRKSRARKTWDIAIEDESHLFALASGVLTHNSNPMPESCRDRPTKGHEYLFLLSKKSRYYYDAEAIKEDSIQGDDRIRNRINNKINNTPGQTVQGYLLRNDYPNRNRRTVWTIATQPLPMAHFASMPEALVEPCIRAGTSQEGYCECGKPWVRVIKRIGGPPQGNHRQRDDFDENCKTAHKTGTVAGSALSKIYAKYGYAENKTIGWQPSCNCKNSTKAPGVVLDPFIGSGTVGLVAKKLNRNYIGIELNPSYIEIAEKRLSQMGLFIGK
jgi:DNA modification methylase